MTAVFCQAQTITYEASSTQTVAHPRNMTNDEPGLVWRSSSVSGAYVVFKTAGVDFDTIALVGNNLRASDTFRVRMGANAADLVGAPAFDQTYPAWSGVKPLDKAISFVQLNMPVSHAYIRIDFASAGNPDGFVEVCRLVLGKRITNAGIDVGAEATFDDRSNVIEGRGFTTIERYTVRQSHKITIGQVTESQFYNDWEPFLASVGQSKFFLYVEETESPYLQRKTFYVRNVQQPKSNRKAYDQQDIDLTVVTYR